MTIKDLTHHRRFGDQPVQQDTLSEAEILEILRRIADQEEVSPDEFAQAAEYLFRRLQTLRPSHDQHPDAS